MEELCVHLIVPFIEVSESRADPTYIHHVKIDFVKILTFDVKSQKCPKLTKWHLLTFLLPFLHRTFLE